MQQIHGNNVVAVDFKNDNQIIGNCDALISNDPKVTLFVRTADCLPIAIINKKSRVFGIIHAGWRGLQKQIIKKTITKIVKEFSIDPKDLEVKVGPHICQKHYEIKDDVSSKFGQYLNSILVMGNKKYLDLAKIAETQLISEGIKKENINIDSICTYEDLSYPSFRRDKTSERFIFKLNIKSS